MENKQQNIGVKLRNNLAEISDEKVRARARFNMTLIKDIKIYIDNSAGVMELCGTINSDEEIGEATVDINLKTNSIDYAQCKCEEFTCEAQICEHIVATVYRYIEAVELGKIEYPRYVETVEQIQKNRGLELLDVLANNKKVAKELINIEVTLLQKSEDIFEANFRIGNNKLYVMKNIIEFINAIDTGKELVFGKGFVFNSNIHHFSKEDSKLINFIREYAKVASVINETTNSYGFYYSYGRTSPIKLVKGKSLILIESALIRFLECAAHKKVTVDLQTFKGKVDVIQNDIPIKFELKENNDDIILSAKEEMPIPLISKGGVFLSDNNLYLPSDGQSARCLPFIKAFNDAERVIFEKEQAEKVFSTIIPEIKNIAYELEMDNNIEEKLTIGDLALELYFDRDRTNIWCNVKAKYDNQVFDLIQGYNGEKYILRDVIKEDNVISTLQDSKFYANKDRFEFTGDEQQLFGFLAKEIEGFKEFGEVYYSDRFKEQKVYKSNSISATLSENGGFLQFEFSMEEIDPKEFNDILKAFKNNRKFYKLKNNNFVDLQDKKTLAFLSLLDNIAGDKKIKGNSFDIDKNKAIYLSNTIEEKKLTFINGKDLVDNIAEKFETLGSVNYKLPNKLNAKLRDYQVKGFNWFKTISHYGFGGILADEMGLGKTVQTIAFLLSEKNKKSLIITPTSLIYNWQNEFKKFAPTMNICILHGSREQRLELIKDINKYDVILTTYGTLRNDLEQYQKIKFDYCIIDEGQNIKNPLAQSSEAIKSIKAKVKFALTGTPIENNLMELWSIFDFVMPGYLNSKTTFQHKFIGETDQQMMDELKRLIRPFILRRLKSKVMEELPDKIEKKFIVEMTDQQKKVYSSYVKDIQQKMESKEFETDKITVFSYLTKLRQLCLDPSIIVDGYNGGAAKINVALDIINENIQSGNKILLFSQFTTVLANIKDQLDKNEIGYYYLDGATKASSRMELVNSFNEDKQKKVFLISLKAGGTGLNLTSANVVIHFDPWWNPAIEEQATDRAHRIGQKNVVEVIKLISQGTVEEKIITMQEEKKELINQVMEGDFKEGSFLKSLSDKEIKELFI